MLSINDYIPKISHAKKTFPFMKREGNIASLFFVLEGRLIRVETWKANLRCYRTYRNRLYLAHHGVKGQKWGVRHGPPYPLDSAKRPKPRVQGSVQKKSPQINGPLDKYMEAGKMKVQELLKKYGKDPVPVFKMKLKPVEENLKSITEDLKAINPTGNQENCVFCSVAYDMRRRGYDVSALPAGQEDIHNIEDICRWYKHPKILTVESAKDNREAYDVLFKKLSEYDDGARGIATGVYRDLPPGLMVGHAVAWQVTKFGPIFMDGQTGHIYLDPYLQLFSGFRADRMEFARLDNLKIRPNEIKEAVKDAE